MYPGVIGVLLASAALAFSTIGAKALDEITVAHSLDRPKLFHAAKVSGAYDEALGMKVKWVGFDTGTALSAAMTSGDVQIVVSQGVPPFVVTTLARLDLRIIDVAISYAGNDNCAVQSELDVFVEAGSIERALATYIGALNTGPLSR